MPQFFIETKLDTGAIVEIRGADFRHISSVLRLGPGDWIVLSDGHGNSFQAEIVSEARGTLKARILEKLPHYSQASPPALAIALIKGDRFEWAIQKAVEIGCQRILPFISSRTVPQYKAYGSKKIERWRQIALAAAKQSGLPFKPAIDEPRSFAEICGLTGDFKCAFFLYVGEKERDIRTFFRGASRPSLEGGLIITGPEGGFTSEEVKMAADSKAVSISLGQQILRVETAAIVTLAIWQYELGNMNCPRHT